MDAATKRRLAWSFLSNWVSRVSSSLIQIVQLPVFLHYWSMPLYGDWLIVNTIPTYLSFSSIGFGSVAGNEMTMMVAREDRAGALRVFQSCWWLIAILCSIAIVVFCAALYFLPAARLLAIHAIDESDTKWIIFYLGLSVLLGQLEQLLQCAYRCVGRYAYGSFVKSVMSLSAFALTLATVALHQGPRIVALVFAAANIACTLIFAWMVKRDLPWLEFGWRHASIAQIKELFRPAIAFICFPIGNSLNLAGSQMAVNYALGSTSVVIFSAARTVSRAAVQMVQMINSTFEPEFTIAFGAGRLDIVKSLHRRACQMALFFAAAVVLVLVAFGPWILTHWSRGRVPPSQGLLTILLAGVLCFALWFTSATLLTATNRHQELALVYVFATAVTCGLCFAMAHWKGLYGAAASLVLSEVTMVVYVLPNSLRLAQDAFPVFIASIWQYPPSLRPATLLARLRRSRPELEAE